MQSLAIIQGADRFKQQIAELGEESPHQAYLVGITLGKIADETKKTYSDKFKAYYNEQKELPGGFLCKITNRKTYCYEENEEWQIAKANLDFIESKIKKATDSNIEFPNPRSGLYIKPVTTKQSEIYSVSRK